MSGDSESVPEQWSDLDDDQRESLLQLAQNQTGEQTVSRREFGKAGVLAALGLSGVAGSAGTVAAQESSNEEVGTIGTDSDRVDVYGDTVFANELVGVDSGGGIFSDSDSDGIYEQTTGSGISTGQGVIGGGTTAPATGISWDRPEVNKSDTTVQVPQDEDTPQDAFRKIPRRFLANYTIEIDETNDYSAEDWVIPPIHSEDLYDSAQGGTSRLTITPQGSGTLNPNSVYVIGGRGQGNVVFTDTYPVGITPWNDENSVWAAFGGQQLKVNNCGIGGSARSSGSVGILSYASLLKIEGEFDWGADLVSVGGKTKHGGMLLFPSGAGPASGSVTEYAWEANTGHIQHGRQGPTAGNKFAEDPQKLGTVVYDQIPMVDESGNFVKFVSITSSDIQIFDRSNTSRIAILDNGEMVFRDDTGSNIARLDASGDLTLAGSVTENGSP